GKVRDAVRTRVSRSTEGCLLLRAARRPRRSHGCLQPAGTHELRNAVCRDAFCRRLCRGIRELRAHPAHGPPLRDHDLARRQGGKAIHRVLVGAPLRRQATLVRSLLRTLGASTRCRGRVVKGPRPLPCDRSYGGGGSSIQRRASSRARKSCTFTRRLSATVSANSGPRKLRPEVST